MAQLVLILKLCILKRGLQSSESGRKKAFYLRLTFQTGQWLKSDFGWVVSVQANHMCSISSNISYLQKSVPMCPKVFPMWSHWQSSAFICKVHTLSFKSLGLVRLFCNVSCLVCSPSCIYHQRDNTVIVWTIIIIYYYFNNY